MRKFKALETMEEGESIMNDYWTLEPGETVKVVFTGMTSMKGMGASAGQDVDAINLVVKDEEGKFKKICADKVLVSACRNLTAPTALSITCTGMVKSKGGFSYKDFEVRKLQ